MTYALEAALRLVNQNYYERGNRAKKLLTYQLRKKQWDRTITKIRYPKTKGY